MRQSFFRPSSLIGWVAAVSAIILPAAVEAPLEACGPAKHGPTRIENTLASLSVSRPASSTMQCVDGWALNYACDNVDLVAVMPREALGTDPNFATGNDLWGWVDPQNGTEWAIMGMADGTVFVDLSDPSNPRYVGKMPTREVVVPWRDMKVYRNHLYVVADGAGHGMQVFDLTRLRGVSSPQVFQPDSMYFGPGLGLNSGIQLSNSHNIAINEATGFAYLLGTSTCDQGLHMVDLSDPRHPTFAGCFGETGYTHDAQCVVYDGLDERYLGRELCFDSDPNPSALTIVDVTDKENPQIVGRHVYEGGAYSHQGWLSPNHRYFYLGDELDEATFGHETRTVIFDLTDLENPTVNQVYNATTLSIGHNMYTVGKFLYQANYTAGLRILQRVGDGLDEVAYFDLYPETDAPAFRGAWTAYPFFPSGNVIVSSIEGGLFVLRPHLPQTPGASGGGDGRAKPMRPAALYLNLQESALHLTWTDRAVNEDGFRVYRSIDQGPRQLLREIGVDETLYIDGGVGPGSVYEYRVTAFNGHGESRPIRASIEIPPTGGQGPGPQHPMEPCLDLWGNPPEGGDGGGHNHLRAPDCGIRKQLPHHD